MNEIEIITAIINLMKPYKVYEELPLKYDFTKDIGVYYVADTISDEVYKDSHNLEIHLIGVPKDKTKLLIACDEIDKKLNKSEPTPLSWITRKNVRRNYIREEDGKHHFILEYYINNLEV